MTAVIESVAQSRRHVRISATGAGVVHHCTAAELMERQAAGTAGAVIMDPPFFTSTGRAADWSVRRGQGADPWTDVSTIDEMVAWSEPIAAQVAKVLRPGGAAVVMGGSQSLAAWEVAAERAGLTWMAELTVLWNAGKPRARKFGSLTTTIRWHAKPGARHAFNAGEQRSIYSNVIVCTKVPIAARRHPAQKPVELTNFLVSLLTEEDDLVIDPFCGSGSTLVSAAMCGRPWLGSDTDLEQCEIAEVRTKRLELEEADLRPLYLWINGRLEEIEG